MAYFNVTYIQPPSQLIFHSKLKHAGPLLKAKVIELGQLFECFYSKWWHVKWDSSSDVFFIISFWSSSKKECYCYYRKISPQPKGKMWRAEYERSWNCNANVEPQTTHQFRLMTIINFYCEVSDMDKLIYQLRHFKMIWIYLLSVELPCTKK